MGLYKRGLKIKMQHGKVFVHQRKKSLPQEECSMPALRLCLADDLCPQEYESALTAAASLPMKSFFPIPAGTS